MSVNDPDVRLGHMLEMASAVQSFVADATMAVFRDSLKLQMAVTYGLQIIGEAASRVDDAARARFPDIPWKQIVGFRHVVVHEYFRVDLDEIWTIATTEIPKLIAMLKGGGICEKP